MIPHWPASFSQKKKMQRTLSSYWKHAGKSRTPAGHRLKTWKKLEI
jgi:carboxylesterase type B